ncbi:MAG: type II toxin-antitoxin system RelE/ParE family toxin [Acidobacteriaceae bacterium]
MVLLHGFVKKTQKTPLADMELARKNKRLHEAEMKGRNRHGKRKSKGA